MLVSASEAHSTVRRLVYTARSCPPAGKWVATFQRLGALRNSYLRPSNPTQVPLVIFFNVFSVLGT